MSTGSGSRATWSRYAKSCRALRSCSRTTPIGRRTSGAGVTGVAESRRRMVSAFALANRHASSRAADLLPPHVEVFEIPESTSRFTPGDRAAARAATGLSGDPCVLWVGHLDRNKDPLTVLAGVAAALEELPQLQLWCCFGTAPLFDEVRACIDADARLRERVHLLGRVPHEQVETLMRAADLFVLGSHREGSSFSLIEALATGLTPVVSDIPSLRTLTSNGAVGALWPRGRCAGAWHGAGACDTQSNSRIARASSGALRRLPVATRHRRTTARRVSRGHRGARSHSDDGLSHERRPSLRVCR